MSRARRVQMNPEGVGRRLGPAGPGPLGSAHKVRNTSSLKARLRDQTEPARWLNHFVQAAYDVAQAAQAISQAKQDLLL
jgi:hypothetical protein